MRDSSGSLLFSATDLVNFLGCAHSTALDIAQVGQASAGAATADPYLELLQEKGLEHERAYLESLRPTAKNLVEVAGESLDDKVSRTRAAMADGADVIYQGALFNVPWHGYSDFLVRRDGIASRFGSYAYEVVDTKLSLSAKPKHVVQLSIYSRLIADEQQASPHQMHIVLGDRSTVSLTVSDFIHYCEIARGRFQVFTNLAKRKTVAEPCGHCAFCRWIDECSSEWERIDHLSLVANITRSQIQKLRSAGVTTLRQLAELKPDSKIPHLAADSLAKIRGQAALQAPRRAGGGPTVEWLPLQTDKGFARLPRPDDGDLFFDMEGDPLFDGGLEYLFGFDHIDGGKVKFTPFWAHTRAEEKKAFQAAVDFICARLAKYPNAHIYHYAAYEETAFKRLAMLHGTRESEIDDLLRKRKLVDLYKVVREGIQTSEPAYSLKNLEVFYGVERKEDVKNAGDSVIVYERWRKIRQPSLLQDISDYNELDCISTRLCRNWLIGLRPEGVEWFDATKGEAPAEISQRDENRREAEAVMLALQESLLAGVPEKDRPWRELVGNLLEFHRREDKPCWWAMFSRMEMSDEEAFEDGECIGWLIPDKDKPPYPVKKSLVYSFRFPSQDFKMRVGDCPRRIGDGAGAGEIVALDEEQGRISLKIGMKRPSLDAPMSLMPPGPIDSGALRAAVYRYATAVAEGREEHYAAITGILKRNEPQLNGRKKGAPILRDADDLLDGAMDGISRMRETHMLMQGPPGSGKTFTSSHAIVDLISKGKRVAVSSNSHKAINNLLTAIEKVAREKEVKFRGVKKSGGEDQALKSTGCITDTGDNAEAADPSNQLVAGTAWLFAKPDFDQAFDYIFVDEAGQVSLANVIVLGMCARNIVLVGDQMQLSQPMQGIHPGDSALSALDYLLGDRATVPPESGIFLAKTWRLHPDVCRFVSDAIYEGRLEAADGNEKQQVLVRPGTKSAAIAGSGIRFIDVEHYGCTQRSDEEAEALCSIYETLLQQRWRNRDGDESNLTTADVLVVTPYNMQVNALKNVLPAGARVGTVDKFQGQEAAVVLISMATSAGEDIPRNIEFLFSRNRLNVAISRAKCLAVIFANPSLLEVPCKTIGQMKLVNTLCWLKRFADAQAVAISHQ